MKIEKKLFGFTESGSEIKIFKIINSSGAFVELTNYGATWISAYIPDKKGNLSDILLGYNNLQDYLKDNAYMGSTVGRFSNRIGNAQFTIHNITYKLDQNDGVNSNHGGFSGFSRRYFDYRVENNAVIFSLFSPDGEGGFPGNINLEVEYLFTEDLKLNISYFAVTDHDTYLNMTNHAYFNLRGKGTVLDQLLYIPAKKMLVTDEFFIPTGEFTTVENTAFDFLKPKSIGQNIFDQNEQLIWNKGYNHCYVLDDRDTKIRLAAVLSDVETGRQLSVYTTKPAILIYTAGFLNPTCIGKNGTLYPYAGICLETQFFPDFPNHQEFPNHMLTKDSIYQHMTQYQFTIN